MKKIIVVSIGIIVIIGLSAQNKKQTDLEKDGLKGKVKSISINHYNAIDKFGRISKSIKLNSDSIEGDIFIKYNNDGFKTDLITCKKSYEFDNESKAEKMFIESYNFKYDNQGNNIETYCYKADKTLNYKEIHLYNENGNEIESSSYESDGNLSTKRVCKYDKNGNIIESSSYKSDGDLSSKLIFKNDEKGNKIELDSYSSDGSLNYKFVYEYDYKGNRIRWESYDSDNELYSKTSYSYYLNGNKADELYNSGDSRYGFFIKYSRYKYDDNNNLIEYSDTDKNVETYSYDNKGNWIEKITYKGEAKIPSIITEQIVEYYE